MAVTIIWLGLALAAAGWEVRCRRSGGRWTCLTSLGARLGSRRYGRLVLIGVWAFIGWHVFARYTVPG